MNLRISRWYVITIEGFEISSSCIGPDLRKFESQSQNLKNTLVARYIDNFEFDILDIVFPVLESVSFPPYRAMFFHWEEFTCKLFLYVFPTDTLQNID